MDLTIRRWLFCQGAFWHGATSLQVQRCCNTKNPVGGFLLWKIWVRQLGWFFPKLKKMIQTTNQEWPEDPNWLISIFRLCPLSKRCGSFWIALPPLLQLPAKRCSQILADIRSQRCGSWWSMMIKIGKYSTGSSKKNLGKWYKWFIHLKRWLSLTYFGSFPQNHSPSFQWGFAPSQESSVVMLRAVFTQILPIYCVFAWN